MQMLAKNIIETLRQRCHCEGGKHWHTRNTRALSLNTMHVALRHSDWLVTFNADPTHCRLPHFLLGVLIGTWFATRLYSYIVQ